MKQIICFGILLLWLVPGASAISIENQPTTEAYPAKHISSPLFEKPSLFKVWKIKKALRAHRGKAGADAKMAGALAWVSLMMGLGGVLLILSHPLFSILLFILGVSLALLGNHLNNKVFDYSSMTRTVALISLILNGVCLLGILALIVTLTILYLNE